MQQPSGQQAGRAGSRCGRQSLWHPLQRNVVQRDAALRLQLQPKVAANLFCIFLDGFFLSLGRHFFLFSALSRHACSARVCVRLCVCACVCMYVCVLCGAPFCRCINRIDAFKSFALFSGLGPRFMAKGSCDCLPLCLPASLPLSAAETARAVPEYAPAGAWHTSASAPALASATCSQDVPAAASSNKAHQAPAQP